VTVPRAETLWAPWRMAYIRKMEAAERRAAARGGVPPKGCLFCRARAAASDRANLIVARHGRAFLMLNRFPYNPAHVMVAVARHAGRFADLGAAEREDLMHLIAVAERALALEYRPHGVNVGANLGRVAGAGVLGHLHVHLVPRWNGDTNFMPTIGETKVLPESLARTWSRMRAAVRAVEGDAGRPDPGAARIARALARRRPRS
jgi:ATP adenylyltransferase